MGLLQASGGWGPKSPSGELRAHPSAWQGAGGCKSGMGSGANERGEQMQTVVCCPSTLQPTPASSNPGNLLAHAELPTSSFPMAPPPGPLQRDPKSPDLGLSGEIMARTPSCLSLSASHDPTPHRTPAGLGRACHGLDYAVLSRRAFPFGTRCFHSKARFLQKGPSSQGCYSQAGFDKIFLSPPSSSRLRGKRSPSESDLEASPWTKTEGFSKEGEGQQCTDTPRKKRIPVSNITPTDPLNFVPRCNITFHKMTHARIYTTD